jgi:hypothetical protein
MGRGLGPFQREVLHRIGRHLMTFGEVRTGTIAKDMAAARGVLTNKVKDICGFDRRVDLAHELGLRRALAALEQRGLIIRYRDGWLELTEAGTIMAGDCKPMTEADLMAEALAERTAQRERTKAAIAAGRLKPNGEPW